MQIDDTYRLLSRGVEQAKSGTFTITAPLHPAMYGESMESRRHMFNFFLVVDTGAL